MQFRTISMMAVSAVAATSTLPPTREPEAPTSAVAEEDVTSSVQNFFEEFNTIMAELEKRAGNAAKKGEEFHDDLGRQFGQLGIFPGVIGF